MTKVLKYFQVNGLAEPIRYILHYTGQEFEDVRYDYMSWRTEANKAGLPYGQLPILEDGGRVLHQSLAIARYVAANTDLLPSDPWEQAVLDAAVLTVYDFHKMSLQFILATTPENKEKARKKLYDEDIDFYFSRFEKQLQENNGHFGSELSWADFILVGIIECANLFLEDTIEKNYPTISNLIKKIQSLPRVREYIASRTPYESF